MALILDSWPHKRKTVKKIHTSDYNMKPKSLPWVGLLLLALLVLPPVPGGYGHEQTPADFVVEFYTWYITTDKGMMFALRDEAICEYVDPVTIARIRNSFSRDKRDYFLKMLDYPPDLNGVDIFAGEATSLGADVFVVPVTIAVKLENIGYQHQVQVVVVLRKTPDGLKIVKCLDLLPEF